MMKIYDENQFTKSKLDEKERGNSLGLESDILDKAKTNLDREVKDSFVAFGDKIKEALKQIIKEGKEDEELAKKYNISDTVVRLLVSKKLGEFYNSDDLATSNNIKDILQKYSGICIINDKGGRFSITLRASEQMHSSTIKFYEKAFKSESILRNKMIKDYINKRFGLHIEKLSIFKNNMKGDELSILIRGSFTFFNF